MIEANAMAPDLSYSDLDGVSDGMAAAYGFLEAIDPATTPERKVEIEEELLTYCKQDTEAMVEITRFLST